MATTVKNHAIGRDTAIDYPGPVDEFAPTTALDDASGATCLFRIFDNDKTVKVKFGDTRLRTAITDVSTQIEIPTMTPAWHEAGDVIEIHFDDGSDYLSTVSSYTAGANFDTIVLGVAVPSDKTAAVGSLVRLTIKFAGAKFFPVELIHYKADVVLEVGDSLEVETDTVATFDTSSTMAALHTLSATEAVDSGTVAPAINQPPLTILELSGTTAVNVTVGRKIRRKIGADVTMGEYTDADGNTPAGSEDWGFKGVIPDTLDLEVGQNLLIEIRFTGGDGLNDKVSFILPVVGG